MLKYLFFAIGLFASAQFAEAQENKNLIQFSGIVVEADSLLPVPFTTLLIKNTRRGTISDYYGYFSFVAQKNDTIEFSSVGFKKAIFIIPDTLTSQHYSVIQVLLKDTIQLKETVVHPWPSREAFKEAFLSLNVPADDLERARQNIAMSEKRDVVNAVPMDGSMNYKWAMQQQQTKLYYAGGQQTNQLLNPIAWAQFVKAWKEGKLKRE